MLLSAELAGHRQEESCMHHLIRHFVTVLMVLLLPLGNTALSAALIEHVVTGRFDLTNGPDPLGLDGAELELRTVFDAEEQYVIRLGFPTALAVSDSLKITGSAAADGVYSESYGLIFYPTFFGQFAGGETQGAPVHWSLGTQVLELQFLLNVVSDEARAGGSIAIEHFGLSPPDNPPPWFWTLPADLPPGGSFEGLLTEYGVQDFAATIQLVPEPKSLVLLLTILAAPRHRRAART
jgi:hypothetical protein